MSVRAATLSVLLLAGAGCASAPAAGSGRRIVDAEGWGADSASALADAQKRAVEEALGVAISASTRVEKAVAVKRRIWADSRGRIESWTVRSDKAENGLRAVRIRAVVVRLAEGEEVPPPNDTKVRIEAPGPAGEGLRRGFVARGFIVVEAGEDFVVTARGAAELLRDPRTAPFVSGRGRVRVSVKNAATGGLVFERSFEAAALDSDPLSASALAVAGAGETGGRDAADGLSKLLWTR